MNIITVQFDENGNAEVTIPKSPTQGDNLTNRLVAKFDATITNIATVRLHAILPNGQSMSSFQFLIKDTSAEVPTFYADLTDYYTQYAGLLKLSVSAQFDGVVQGYDTVIVEDDLDALNALETKDETYAYVTRDTWAVYNWNGSAFVENELLIYDIPVDFQKEFTIYIDEAVTSIGNVSIPLDSYTQLLLMINNTANRVSNVEDSYATKAQSIIIVESLPTLTGGAYDGRYFYLTTDNNVYKINNETAYKVSNTTYLGTFTTPQNAVNYMVVQMTTQLPSNKLYIASETSGGVMLIMKNNGGGFTVYLNNIRYKYDDAGVFDVEEEYRYNSTLDTYEFKHQDGSWQTINESWIKVKMTESVLKMQVVRITELQGANNLASKAVLADIQPNIDYDFGITRNDISTNGFDTVIRLGKLDNIATNDWAENDTLYLSDTIPGGITNIAPAVKVIVGFVRKASSTPTATNGSIYVVFKNLPRIATQTSDGLMSSEDKVKLDGLPTGAELDSEFSNVQGEIDNLKNNPDVSDIVQTYADLVIYDTSKLTENDIVEVLIDETRNSNKTLYRWTESLGFTYIGYSINYTQAEKDKLSDLPNNDSLNLLLNELVKDIGLQQETLPLINNLCEMRNIVSGYFINYTNGSVSVNADYMYCYDYFKIDGDEDYVISIYLNGFLYSPFNQFIIFYDERKNFVSGLSDSIGTIHTPATAKYIRLSMSLTIYNTYKIMIEKGTTRSLEYVKPTRLVYNSNILYTMTVGSNPFDNYSTLTEAVRCAKDGDIIFVRNGVYDGEIVRAWGKNITIIGEDKEKTIIKNGLNTYSKPPLEMSCGKLANMTIYSYDGGSPSQDQNGLISYGIHIDDDGLYENTLVIENCIIKSDKNSSLGIGLRKGTLRFENCECISKEKFGMFFHDSVSPDYAGDEYLICKNCIFTSQETAYAININSQKTVGNNVYPSFTGCVCSTASSVPLIGATNTDNTGGQATTIGTFMGLINFYQVKTSRNNYPNTLDYQ